MTEVLCGRQVIGRCFSDGIPDTSNIKSGRYSAKGLVGHDFEDYLTKDIGGNGSFSVGGRDFDGGIDNRWGKQSQEIIRS